MFGPKIPQGSIDDILRLQIELINENDAQRKLIANLLEKLSKAANFINRINEFEAEIAQFRKMLEAALAAISVKEPKHE